MGGIDDQIACPKCGTRIGEKPKRSFLGFRRFRCPACSTESTLPMTSGYRTASWMGFVLCALFGIFGGLIDRNPVGFLLWGGAALGFGVALPRVGALRAG